jgi:hypothetical protein
MNVEKDDDDDDLDKKANTGDLSFGAIGRIVEENGTKS